MAEPPSRAPREPFRLGDWTVEPELGRITREDEVVQLRPRAMDVLVCLAELEGRLASKQHLIDSVWRTEFVSANALTHVIAELRTRLGDDPEQPSYIETIPRRGYRVIAAVVFPEPDRRRPRPEAARFKLVADDVDYPLTEGGNLIGRAPEAEVRIDSSEVSRRHARIVIDGDTATIEDLDSKNGTFLRGRRLCEPARLSDADEIRIGLDLARFRFVVLDDRTRTEQARRAQRD